MNVAWVPGASWQGKSSLIDWRQSRGCIGRTLAAALVLSLSYWHSNAHHQKYMD
jgi:hypothetical protein